MKAVRPVIASNEVHYLQMISIGSHSRPAREKEGKDGIEYFFVRITTYRDMFIGSFFNFF